METVMDGIVDSGVSIDAGAAGEAAPMEQGAEGTAEIESGADPPNVSGDEAQAEAEPHAEGSQRSDLEMELEAYRMQEQIRAEDAALLNTAREQMAADLAAIQAIDPSVSSLEGLEGYLELAERGITGTDAFFILQGRKAVEGRGELAHLKMQNEMAADLAAIQAIDPSVSSLEEIEGYPEAIQRGCSAEDAYYIAKGKAARRAELTPASVGTVGSPGEIDTELDPAALDSLSKRELLENPKMYDKAMRALSKLKSNNY